MSLISTSDLRTWMGIEEGDKKPNAKLSLVAQAIEDFVDGYCNRKFEAAVYHTDPQWCYIDGNGRNYTYLPLYPVSYISSVAIDSDRVFGSGTLLASDDFFWYPSGKIISEGGNFITGRRNIRVHFTAGYAPVVGGTHSMAVSTYPIPLDLKQTMIEMSVQSFKEGMTAIHSVPASPGGEGGITQMLSRNSFWRNVLNKYKAFDAHLGGREE